jgi:general secretion pathway protein G
VRYKIDSFSAVRSLDRCHPSRFIRLNRLGFSLTELIVVMVIMGMLAGVVAFAMGGVSDSARKTKAITDISQYVNAIDAFYAVQGRYPTNDEGLTVLTAKTKQSPSGYIKKIKKDPWSHPYVYRLPGSAGGPFEVLSYAADGKEGGTEVNADISSENLEND